MELEFVCLHENTCIVCFVLRGDIGHTFLTHNFRPFTIYNIYINDLPEWLDDDSNIYLYADDAKLFRRISTGQDSLLLQDDINKL